MKGKIILPIIILVVIITGITLVVSGNTALTDKKEKAETSQGIDKEELERFYAGIEDEELLKFYQGIEDEELLKYYMKVINDQNRRKEQKQAILEKSIKEKGLPPNEEEIAANDEFAGLNDKQIEQVKTLRENRRMGLFLRKEAIIRGDIQEDTPRLDLETAKKIITENEAFRNILLEFDKFHGAPDCVYGSGVSIMEYWLDENGYEKIYVILEGGKIWLESSSQTDSTIDGYESETLFPEKKS